MESRPAAERREDLVKLFNELKGCQKCPLHQSRTNVVFGMGNPNADLMFVGEAPGFHEDQQGLPFVGRAGQLLDRLLGDIGLERRRDVFIANILKSRPPGNRDPRPEEIDACTPHLTRQIELIEPKVICTLGNFATKFLTGSQQGITRAHGKAQDCEVAGLEIKLFPLFHPAAALRAPSVLALLEQDFAAIPALLAEARPEPVAAGAGQLDLFASG